MHAEALGWAGQLEKGLGIVAEAVELSAGDRRWKAMAHRLRGNLLLAARWRDEAAAEGAFRSAIEIAHGQDAKSLELRAASSLARLWAEQGERRKALDLLAPVYGCFTEGFDTADLRDAKAVLDELASFVERQIPHACGDRQHPGQSVRFLGIGKCGLCAEILQQLRIT